MKKRTYYTTKSIIDKFKKIHKDNYDYSKFNYSKMHENSIIICPIHGEFKQSAHSHLKGQGCPVCGKLKRIKKKKYTKEDFVKKAKNKFENKFNYSNLKYIDYETETIFSCPIHGEFKATPHMHINYKCGCPKCGIEHRTSVLTDNVEEFIAKAKKVHGDKYDYSQVNYINSYGIVSIICPIHGKFNMRAGTHINNKEGCPICGQIKSIESRKQTTEEFIEKAKKIHGDKYDYSLTEYKGTNILIKIICNKHGLFTQYPYYHLDGCGCQQCAKENKISIFENEIALFLNQNNIIFNKSNRKIITPLELDLYIPSHKLAIEFNGIYWHNEINQPNKNYHLNKLNQCNTKGIKLIQIFEDEYLEHKNIVLSKIKHILEKDNDLPKVQARKCIIKEIDKDTSRDFLNKNHIQGACNASIHLGCFQDNTLVGVMTFKEERKGNNRWELNRFATDITKRCIGVGGKLFKYFIKTYNPDYIKSFADRRWTLDKDNNLYTKLGFTLGEVLKPDYRYVNRLKREHKFGFRKQILMKKYPDKGLTMEMTEKEMCDKLGFYRIWDCGLFKFEWEV